MKKKKIKVSDKVYKILGSVSLFGLDNASSEYYARQEVSKTMSELKEKYETLNFTTYVDDLTKSNWRTKEHFTKVFDDEIKYCKEQYKLTRTDIAFLKELGEFLLWQVNMLVDEEGNPLNQTELAKLMDISTRTIRNNMKSLEEKKCVFSIPYEKDVYYLINPYLLYKGSKINMYLPVLFTDCGYIPLETIVNV